MKAPSTRSLFPGSLNRFIEATAQPRREMSGLVYTSPDASSRCIEEQSRWRQPPKAEPRLRSYCHGPRRRMSWRFLTNRHGRASSTNDDALERGVALGNRAAGRGDGQRRTAGWSAGLPGPNEWCLLADSLSGRKSVTRRQRDGRLRCRGENIGRDDRQKPGKFLDPRRNCPWRDPCTGVGQGHRPKPKIRGARDNERQEDERAHLEQNYDERPDARPAQLCDRRPIPRLLLPAPVELNP